MIIWSQTWLLMFIISFVLISIKLMGNFWTNGEVINDFSCLMVNLLMISNDSQNQVVVSYTDYYKTLSSFIETQ